MNNIEEPVNMRKWHLLTTFCLYTLLVFIMGFHNGRATQSIKPSEFVKPTAIESVEEVTSEHEHESESESEPEPESNLMYAIDIPTKPTYTITIDSVTEPTECLSEAENEPETSESAIEYSEEDAELLAIVIYQEAGADYCCDDCRRRVADVVLNRVESDLYPDSIYEVLTQEYQYGTLHWTGVVWPASASEECNAHAVERARRIAREVLCGYHSEVYGENYIGQAGFVQGIDGFWCCGIYFAKF